MKIKQTVKNIVFGLGLIVGLVSLSGSLTAVSAADCTTGTPDTIERCKAAKSGTSTPTGTSNNDPCTTDTESTKCCGGVATSIIGCTQRGSKSDVEQTGLWGALLIAINILTAGVGVLAVAGVVYGSIMYASAGGSAEQTKKAMGIITNVVIGVIAYALMYVVLNFLVPGGLFKN